MTIGKKKKRNIDELKSKASPTGHAFGKMPFWFEGRRKKRLYPWLREGEIFLVARKHRQPRKGGGVEFILLRY